MQKVRRMAKLTVLAAILLVALLAIASATAHRTTITTTVLEDEEDPGQGGQSQRCQQKIQEQQQQLWHCQQYLSQMSPSDLRMYPLPGQQEEHLRPCCQTLENFDEQCVCEAVMYVVRQQLQQGGGWQGEEMQQQVMQKAKNLPRKCNLEPQQCQIGAVFI